MASLFSKPNPNRREAHPGIEAGWLRGTLPPAVRACTMVLINRQCFIFGGWSSETSYVADLYSISLSRDVIIKEQLTISPVIACGDHPAARAGHAACATDKYMAVFGGANGTEGYLNDMFLLDTETMEWSKVLYESPPPPGRSRHAMEWLPALQSLVVVGGADESRDFGDLWLFHLPTRKWSQPVTTGPAPCRRWGLTATHSRGKLFVFGGQQTGAPPDANVAANNMAPSNGPVSATGAAGASRHSAENGAAANPKLALPRLHVDDGRSLCEMFELDLASLEWQPSAVWAGTVPPPRAGHTMSLMGERYLVMFGGGSDAYTMMSDIHVYDTLAREWIQLMASTNASAVPAPRWAHSGAAIDGQLIIFGGANGAMALGDVVFIAVDLMMARNQAERLGGHLTLDALVTMPSPMGPPSTLTAGSSATSSMDDMLSLASGGAVGGGGGGGVMAGAGGPPLSPVVPQLMQQQRGVPNPVHNWLRALGLVEYASLFTEEGISMRMLPFMTEEHLDEMGIDSLAARLTLLAGIHALRAQLLPSQGGAGGGDHVATLAQTVVELGRAIEALHAKGGGRQ